MSFQDLKYVKGNYVRLLGLGEGGWLMRIRIGYDDVDRLLTSG